MHYESQKHVFDLIDDMGAEQHRPCYFASSSAVLSGDVVDPRLCSKVAEVLAHAG
jgi:hypothetical protein